MVIYVEVEADSREKALNTRFFKRLCAKRLMVYNGDISLIRVTSQESQNAKYVSNQSTNVVNLFSHQASSSILKPTPFCNKGVLAICLSICRSHSEQLAFCRSLLEASLPFPGVPFLGMVKTLCLHPESQTLSTKAFQLSFSNTASRCYGIRKSQTVLGSSFHGTTQSVQVFGQKTSAVSAHWIVRRHHLPAPTPNNSRAFGHQLKGECGSFS